jgi:prevent-host-death family protein
MRSIGIRELRQRASEYLRLVASGETVEVTDRGRPIAMLVPISDRDPLERLEASGRMSRGEGDLLELGDPLSPEAGVPLPSEILAGMRADER